MDTVKVTNKGFRRDFLVKTYTLKPNAFMDVTAEEANFIRQNAIELQKPTPGPDRFSITRLRGDLYRIKNITPQLNGLHGSGSMSNTIQFHVPLVLLRPSAIDRSADVRSIKVIPSVTDVPLDHMAEIFKNDHARNTFLSLLGSPDGISCQLPADDERFTKYL